LDEHLLLLTKLNIENCGDRLYNSIIESYLHRRRSFYTELNSFNKNRLYHETENTPSPWQVIALLLLYRDGLVREKALSLAKEIYYEAWSSLGGGYTTDWLRRLHSLWSKDYLLEFEPLLILHKRVMENDTIHEWYQEHNTMCKEGSNDPVAVMIFHESMMDGTAMINRILSKQVELPISEPSAATSPARDARSRKSYDIENPLGWNTRDQNDPFVTSPMSDWGQEGGYHLKDGPSRHSRSFEAKEERLQSIRKDSLMGAVSTGAGVSISRRSPLNQTLCSSPPVSNLEKKANNFFC